MACNPLFFWRKEKHPGPTGPPPTTEVPVTPKPVVQPLTMAPWVFCNWANPNPYITADGVRLGVDGTQAPFRNPWSPEVMLKRDRVPAIGEYNEMDPEVTQWRLAKMIEGNLDVAVYQVGWSHQLVTKYPDGLPRVDSPLLNSWCADNHPADSPVKFALSLWDAITGPGGPDYWTALRVDRKWNDDDVRLSMREFAKAVVPYMKRPNYWRIDDRPVLVRGWAHTLAFFQERYGFNVSPEEITSIWKEEIRGVLGVDPFLVATSMEPSYRHNLKAWHFDGLSEYLLQADGWGNTMNAYRGWWETDIDLCKEQGLTYFVPVTAGYDSSAEAVGGLGPPIHMPTAAQFEAHVREARAFALKHYAITKGIVTEYAWSEIREGGIIEPQLPGMLHDGDELLRAHAAACQ